MRIVKIKLYFDKIKAGTILSVKFTTREAFESNDVGGWMQMRVGATTTIVEDTLLKQQERYHYYSSHFALRTKTP